MQKDDLPYRSMRELVEVVDGEMTEALKEHVEEYHLPGPRSRPLQNAMWAKHTIPDEVCCRMGELMEEEGLGIDELARRFGYPYTLVKREMADYLEAQDRWIYRRSKLALG